MFPLIAIGAAILGAVGAVAATESSSKSSAPKPKPSADQARNAVLPQSYVLTPVTGEQVRTITPMEGVTRFIV